MNAHNELFMNVSRWLTLSAFAGLLFRVGIFKPYTLQAFEILIIAASTVALIAFLREKDGWNLYWKKISMWFWFFLVITLLFAAGAVNHLQIFGFHQSVFIPTTKDFFFLATVFLGFLMALLHGTSSAFRKSALYFMSGTALFIPFIFFPDLAMKIGFMDGSLHFTGWHGNPTVFGMFALIPLIIFSEQALRQTRWRKKLIFWAAATLLSSLVLWSASRSVWLAAAGAMFFISIVHIRTACSGEQKVKRALSIFFAGIVSLCLSFLLLAAPTKIMVLDRIFPEISQSTAQFEVFTQTSLRGALLVIREHGDQNLALIPYQNRQTIWPQAFRLLKKHPYGLGPEYYRASNAIYDGSKGITSAHNTILQSGLSGGLLLTATYALFWIVVWRSLLRQTRNQEWVWFVGILLSLSLVLLFGDFLFSIPWVWILAGLAVAHGQERDTVPRTTADIVK